LFKLIEILEKPMSEKWNSKNNFEVIERLGKKYFLEIEHTIPHLQQTLFDFQNEFYKTWKNSINANISLQKEFTTKLGLNSTSSNSIQKMIETVNDENYKFRSLYNKNLIKSIETGKENIKVWNDNATTFVDLNQKIMQYWISAFTLK